MIPAKRLRYSAIVDRPPLRLPDKARVVVWPVVNVEVWDIARPMPRLPPVMSATRLVFIILYRGGTEGMEKILWNTNRR